MDSINLLSPEVRLPIFSRLTTEENRNYRSVCKLWNEELQDKSLHRSYAKAKAKSMGFAMEKPDEISWKQWHYLLDPPPLKWARASGQPVTLESVTAKPKAQLRYRLKLLGSYAVCCPLFLSGVKLHTFVYWVMSPVLVIIVNSDSRRGIGPTPIAIWAFASIGIFSSYVRRASSCVALLNVGYIAVAAYRVWRTRAIFNQSCRIQAAVNLARASRSDIIQAYRWGRLDAKQIRHLLAAKQIQAKVGSSGQLTEALNRIFKLDKGHDRVKAGVATRLSAF